MTQTTDTTYAIVTPRPARPVSEYPACATCGHELSYRDVARHEDCEIEAALAFAQGDAS